MKLRNFMSTVFLVSLLTVVLFVGVWQIKPTNATALFTSGWENSGGVDVTDGGAWTGKTGNPTVTTSTPHTGTYCAEITAVDYYVKKTISPINEVYVRCYVRTSVMPPNTDYQRFLQIYDNYGGCRLANAMFYQLGDVTYFMLESYDAAGTGETVTGSVHPVVNQYYCVELWWNGTTAQGAKLWVDGVLDSTATITTRGGANQAREIQVGAENHFGGAGAIQRIDDVEVNTAHIGPIGADSTVPTFGATIANSTLAGNGTQISCTMSDDTALSAWGFAWNNTGAWVNASKVAVSGSPVTALYNGTWNETIGNKVQVQFWANDTTNNPAYSSIQTFTLTGSYAISATYMYRIFVNATATYRRTATGVDDDSGTSLNVINNAISNATVAGSPRNIYVYNGTYLIAGTIRMKNNVTLVLQDAVNITETGSNNPVFSWGWFPYTCSHAWIITEYGAIIKGKGTTSGDSEIGFVSYANQGATLNDSIISYGSLEVWNIGRAWMEFYNCYNSTFQNINAHDWGMYPSFAWVGMLFDGAQNCEILNITSNGNSGLTRSALVIGGQTYSANNVNITGGLYENAYYDNGIYLGGWEQPVTNIRIENVTTAYNNAAHTAHSGLKIRPACNVTVVNWTSNYDYNGIEVDSTSDSEGSTYLTGGSWYNNISGTINYPYNTGLILDVFGSDIGQSHMYNTFNLAINNATVASVWIDNSYPLTDTKLNYNTIYLNSTGANRQAIDFSASGGENSHNTFFCRFIQNGKSGFHDIDIENTTGSTYNSFYVYSTTLNPNGLMGFVNGTGNNYVYYPYSAGAPLTVDVTLLSPLNETYTYTAISVEIYAIGGTIDKIWWNIKNGSDWVYGTNQTYTTATTMTGIVSGSYVFYGWANNTLGTVGEETVNFTVIIATFTSEWGGYWGRWWGYP